MPVLPASHRVPRFLNLLRLAALAAWLLGATSFPAAEVRRDQTVRAIEQVMPSVVNISSKTVVRRQGYFFDWWRENWSPFYQALPPQYSAGSGVIIDEEGYVLTNVHVVEGADEIVVTLADKRTFPADLVIGTRKSDVALLKLRAQPGERFVPIRFAGDDDLLLGETVLALGNPFGLGGSVSKGILSSKTRRSSPNDATLDIEDWIQTDAAINPGNSGGPLVNLEGELIGLNVAMFKDGQGIGFAIPVKRLSESLGEIFTPETLKSLWFGAQFKSGTNGISVLTVEPDSPADKGDLRKGDLILRLNKEVPKSAFALLREILAHSDDDLVFGIRRGRENRSASVRLVPEESFFNADLIERKIGATVQPVAPRAAASLGLRGGLVVTGIVRDSPADHAGFQQGLIMEGFDNQAVNTVAGAARLLHRKRRGETVRISLIVPNPARRTAVELTVQ